MAHIACTPEGVASREGTRPVRGSGGYPGDVGHSVPDHPPHVPTLELQTGEEAMRDQLTRVAASSLLACSAFALCVSVSPPAMADGQGAHKAFTKGSLQGRYAYVNNTGNVASLGPITFDGHGGLKLQLVTNTPCENPRSEEHT